MPVVINDVSVAEPPTTTAPAPAPAAGGGGGATADRIAHEAERHWRRVADLQERVRAD
jgi:hypothetical protein